MLWGYWASNAGYVTILTREKLHNNEKIPKHMTTSRNLYGWLSKHTWEISSIESKQLKGIA